MFQCLDMLKMTKDKKTEPLSCDNHQSIVKLSLSVSFLVATSQNKSFVSLPGILQTKFRSWRAQWNTTRRNWRTWDSSGDRYTVTHRQQQQLNMLLWGLWLTFSYSIQYPLVCKKQHILSYWYLLLITAVLYLSQRAQMKHTFLSLYSRISSWRRRTQCWCRPTSAWKKSYERRMLPRPNWRHTRDRYPTNSCDDVHIELQQIIIID